MVPKRYLKHLFDANVVIDFNLPLCFWNKAPIRRLWCDMKSDGQTLLEIWRNTSSHVRGIIANGEVTVFPNCPNLTSLVLCTIWSYSTSLHITPHIPIIEIRDTETAIIWKWGTLKQQVRYERVKWNSEGMAIDWGKLYVLKDLFFYFLFFEEWKKDLFLLFE